MDYENIIERFMDNNNWDEEGKNTAVSKEEEDFMISHLKERFRNGEFIDYDEFNLIFNWEIFSYDCGNIVGEGRHGWVIKEYIIHIEDDEHYMVTFWYHDDYGVEEYDPQEPRRCYYIEVKVMKWVCEEENNANSN
jgi:hypothetical protein